jgi:NADPH:quinone reductase-like Zn-dependent oxidoreductase
MKAVVYERYGPPEVLELKDLPQPTPKEHEVLIKVLATTVTSGDCRVRSLNVPKGFGLIVRIVFGWSRPRKKILGTEFSGVVSAIGSEVTNFKVGDEVFGFSDVEMGCYAEYKCMSENGALALKPAQLTHFNAAALSFGGTTALNFFKRANLKSGEKVLIHGASGSVGTAAIQLAKHFGAKVTGVCSTGNVELVKSLGADEVIDYFKLDFTTNGITYDVILDTVGTVTFSRARHSLKEGGRLLAIAADLPEMLKIPLAHLSSTKKVVAGTATANPEDLRTLAQLAASGVFKPVIDRFFPLAQIVEAHRYVEKGHKVGNVIIATGSPC